MEKAEKARTKITAMRRRIPSNAQVRGARARDLLANEHQRLVDLLEVIASRPEDVTTDTYHVIEAAKKEAIRIYAKAGKQRTQTGSATPKNLRRKVRREGKVRPEDTSEPDGQVIVQGDEDMVTEAMLKDRARHASETAEYQALLDQYTNGGS